MSAPKVFRLLVAGAMLEAAAEALKETDCDLLTSGQVDEFCDVVLLLGVDAPPDVQAAMEEARAATVLRLTRAFGGVL